MRILVTNDDGIFAEGLECLVEALAQLGEIIVVAPDREQSASSHSLTINRPLRLRRLSEHRYTVDGTPTDCVNLAVQGLLKESPPDLVVSGINYGLNLGGDVTYSGTVSAAFEASLHHLPGIAFSQDVAQEASFPAAAEMAREIVAALTLGGVPDELLLNVNFPVDRPRGIQWTRLGKRTYSQTVVEKLDPKGRKYYWIAGKANWQKESGTDYHAVKSGYASVTPLHLDLTDYAELEGSSDLLGRLEGIELVKPAGSPAEDVSA
ncbi:MAG: 5'/3'-nucleotidase SurE [Acidobacteriota bacterium]